MIADAAALVLCWAPLAGLALLIGACGPKHTPQELLQQAEARLAANDPAGAQSLVLEALNQAPNDARSRIALARAELAMGNPAAAAGSLERAMQLGAPKEEVAGDLARVLLAKGEPQRVIDLVGDLDQWPQPRRLLLALSKAEAALALARLRPTSADEELRRLFSLARLRAARRRDRRPRLVRSPHRGVAWQARRGRRWLSARDL